MPFLFLFLSLFYYYYYYYYYLKSTPYFLFVHVLHFFEHKILRYALRCHNWLVNSGEMVIYAFLLEFFSPYNQKHVTSKSRSCDKKL